MTAAASITMASTQLHLTAQQRSQSRAGERADHRNHAERAPWRFTLPAFQWLITPTRLVTPTTGRLIAMASFGS